MTPQQDRYKVVINHEEQYSIWPGEPDGHGRRLEAPRAGMEAYRDGGRPRQVPAPGRRGMDRHAPPERPQTSFWLLDRWQARSNSEELPTVIS